MRGNLASAEKTEEERELRTEYQAVMYNGSYRRKKLNGKRPYEAFCFYDGEDLAERLGCREVAAKDSNLTAGLLKK